MSRVWLGLCFVAVALSSANAAIVYQQGPVWAGTGTDVGSGWTSQVDSALTGFRTFDNFTLGANATITQATWIGMYINLGVLTDGAQNTTNWLVQFQADSAGQPGSVLSSTTIPAGQVSVQTLGTGTFGGNTVTVLQFTANLTPFAATAGTTYWFSPLSSATTFSPLFSWLEGTGGDGFTFQRHSTNGSLDTSFVRVSDRAFTLSDVPEPGTMALIGIGLGALALINRRRS